MLNGLANILLRNHMDGILTEYKKMKIGKYEIPISACASLFGNEVYSERPVLDNGEEKTRMEAVMDELARKYDEAKAAKTKKTPKPKKKFPPTRRQRIEAARHEYGIIKFLFSSVDTENRFTLDGITYRIDTELPQYAATKTSDGEDYYAMDRVVCGIALDGIEFFDMNIEKISDRVKKVD